MAHSPSSSRKHPPLDLLAGQISELATEIEQWAKHHIIAEGSTGGPATFRPEGIDIESLLDEFREDPDLNSYGPVWVNVAFATKFEDRLDRILLDLPSGPLSRQFSNGPRLDWHQVYKVARRLDVLLIHEVTGEDNILGQNVNKDHIPAAGLWAVLRYELIRFARRLGWFAHEARSYPKDRRERRIKRAEERLQNYAEVAEDWEELYEDLKHGNICGLRKMDRIDQLNWFRSLLEYGAAAMRCADLGIPITSACAVDWRRLKAASARGDRTAPRTELPALNPDQRRALHIIQTEGPIPGKELAVRLKMSFENLRRWFTADGPLTAHGVRNRRDGSGYFIE
jgi:hypothetical protein